MKHKISILGCGWLGLPLANLLSHKNYSIKGSTTSVSKIPVLKEQGVLPYLIDLKDYGTNFMEFLDSESLVICITSKSIEGFKNLIRQIELSSIKQVLFISSTSVYPNLNQIVTEESPIKESLLSDIEQLFRANLNFKTSVIRFGGLFGYNRKPGNFFKGNKIINNPEGHINLIHRDDCVKIIMDIISANMWGEILNACTDSHPTRRVFYTQEMLKLGREMPIFNEKSSNEYKIVSNEKLKTLLGYHFIYPDLMNLLLE